MREKRVQEKNDNNTSKGTQITSLRAYIHKYTRAKERQKERDIGIVDLISLCV